MNNIKNNKSNQSTAVNSQEKKTNHLEKNNKQNAMYIIFKAYDNAILDNAVKLVIDLIKQDTSLYYKGPIPLPSKKIITTILTSPHIDKHAMNQFQQVISKRIIYVVNNQKFIGTILNQTQSLPFGVDVKIKLVVAKRGK